MKTPEQYLQDYTDQLVVQMADTAILATSVYSGSHVLSDKETPTLEQAMEYARWTWQVFVDEPLSRLKEDVDVEPTEYDDVRQHFMMMARRQHLDAVELMDKIMDHIHERDEVEDEPGGQYL